MKPEIKKFLFFLFLTFSYSLQAIVRAYQYSYVYFFGFMIAVAFLYVIKNKYIGALAGVVLLVATEFYDTNYKFLTVIAFLLICAHRNLHFSLLPEEKKKKDSGGFSFICVQLAIFATIALFIYSSVLLINDTKINNDTMDFSRVYLILMWFIGIFVYSLFKNKSDKHKKSANKINKSVSDSLRFMYLVSILGFSATVLFTYAKTGFILISYNAIFFPWFVYICAMVYNCDPYIESLAKSIEESIHKISYKK